MKRRKDRIPIEKMALPKINDGQIKEIATALTKQIDKELFNKKYASAVEILKLVGTGVFIAGSFAIPTFPMALKPFLKDENEYEVWKRFNIPYLKRTLKRLGKQKLVDITEKDEKQVVEITEFGKRRILKYALDELVIEKPKNWDGKWRLISYDIPVKLKRLRTIFNEYIRAWGFYPLHESVFLHAYPCLKQMEFLRGYLGIGEYVRFFLVDRIENDKPFREFFGI